MLSQRLFVLPCLVSFEEESYNVDKQDSHVDTDRPADEVKQVVAIVIPMDWVWNEICESYHRDNY